MRRDFSEGKGGHKTTMAVTYGASNDRGNIVTTFQYRKNERTFSRNREYSRSGSNEFAPTANYQTASSGKIANDRCPGGNAINDDGECLFTYANFSTELPEIEQINNFTSFSYDLTSNWNVNGNVKATRKETEWSYAPGANSLLYSDNAFYQTEFGATAVPDAYKNLPGYDSTNPNDYIWAKWRSLALGTRDTEVREDSFGGSLSLKRYIGDTWETEATVNADRIERRSDSVNGYAKRADLDALLNSGEFNILTNEGELPDSIRYQPWEMAKTEVTSGDIRATGEVIEGWAGPIAMAVGGSYSYEKYSNSRDELSLAGGVAGGGAGSIGYGTRHTQAAYMELAVPLHESVELSLAGRYDKFSDFGDTTNPKIAVKWKPSSIFMVRASAGTGFKAPEMINLHRGASSGQRNVVDVRNCPEEDWTDCNTVSITNKTQGNKDLKPEKSTSMNIGFVAQPTKEFSFTADYFKATITDQVGTALQNLLIVEAQGGDLSQYNSQILRGDDGTLLGVNSGPINMGKTVTSGIDLGAEYSTFVRGMGQFTIKNSYSYLLYHKQSSVFSTQLTDFVGTTSISSGLAYPKWRNQALIGFSRKKLSTNLSFNTISKYQKAVKNQGEMRSFTRIDGSVSYEILTDGILTIGAHNLIGRDAPRDDTITSSAADQLHGELYSTNGRSFFAQYKQTF
jgi:outer membrane receptor protein involved in Fe transport